MKKQPIKKRFKDHELDRIPTDQPLDWDAGVESEEINQDSSNINSVPPKELNAQDNLPNPKKCEPEKNQDPKTEAEKAPEPPIPPKIKFSDVLCTLDDIWDLPEDENKFLVDKFIPREAITIIGGASDVGKSLFSMQLAIAIAKGNKKVLGLDIKAEFNSVLMVSTEDNRIQILSRIRKQLNGKVLEQQIRRRLIILTTSEDVFQVRVLV